ncbi:AAA family ATPase [Candidatus Dependentiae bacterium]|nr:AAA family ATPase [Candidatus Dependentiae bacterium]
MMKKNQFYLFLIINLFNVLPLISMQPQRSQVRGQATTVGEALQQVEAVTQRANYLREVVNNGIVRLNQSIALAHHSNDKSIEAFQVSTQALAQANQVATQIEESRELHAQMRQYAQTATATLETEFNRLKDALAQEVIRNEAVRANDARIHNEFDRETRIQLQRAEIHEKQRLGIFEQEEKIKAQAATDVEKIKWNTIQKMIDSPKRIIKIVIAVTAIALGVYAAQYGIPLVMNYFTQPKVISETSKKGWFGWSKPPRVSCLKDLIFTPELHKQLFDLVLRVQFAKMYNENLPNVLFFGASGTGKTAFAKELAYYLDIDYALTSGSEFAKITDLNLANSEFRKLLDWAKNSEKGLIVFIDEAESLFANRKLPTTSQGIQDFINTFLALVPEKSQKNLMFIFATNHPFKLDDAIIDRIGMNIEFTLPEKAEREKILASYLEKFAQENSEAVVDLHQDVLENLSIYADLLEGVCPRAIKFIAQEMVVQARRQEPKQLTGEIAQTALDQAMKSLQQAELWEKVRVQWARDLARIAA